MTKYETLMMLSNAGGCLERGSLRYPLKLELDLGDRIAVDILNSAFAAVYHGRDRLMEVSRLVELHRMMVVDN